MTLEKLQNDMKEAMKSGNHARKQVISDMIAAIKNASYTPKGKVEITDKLVDEVLIKYQKMVQEMIDTCPSSRTDLLDEYKANIEIVKEYAPKLLTDEKEIWDFIQSLNIELITTNRGLIMKELKGKVDMKIANKILGEKL